MAPNDTDVKEEVGSLNSDAPKQFEVIASQTKEASPGEATESPFSAFGEQFYLTVVKTAYGYCHVQVTVSTGTTLIADEIDLTAETPVVRQLAAKISEAIRRYLIIGQRIGDLLA